MKRRHLVLAALLAPPVSAVGANAFGSYPEKPVRIVVPWPPGGLVDIPARLLAEKLQTALGQPVIVENKTGAGGTIGADAVAKAAADGYVLLVTTSALNMNAAIQPKLPFDTAQAFEPIALLAFAPNILVTNPATGPKTLQELIARARANPGQMTYASAGNGSPAHFAGEMFKARFGLDVLHVAYKGAPPAMLDQISGRIDYQFANAAVALPQIKAGKIRALGVASAKRFAPLPDLPTMGELGVSGFDTDQWIGLLAPRGVARPIVEHLNSEAAKAMASEDVRSALLRNGLIPTDAASPQQFGNHVKQDLAKWQEVARIAHIQP